MLAVVSSGCMAVCRAEGPRLRGRTDLFEIDSASVVGLLRQT
jgi:hypothetical protein